MLANPTKEATLIRLAPPVAVGWIGAEENKFIANRSICSKDKLELDSRRVIDCQLVVSILRRIKDRGNVQLGSAIQLAMTFDVSCHAVDDVRHGYTGVGLVRVAVDNGGFVDGAIHGEGE
jgi:hypothetical protein